MSFYSYFQADEFKLRSFTKSQKDCINCAFFWKIFAGLKHGMYYIRFFIGFKGFLVFINYVGFAQKNVPIFIAFCTLAKGQLISKGPFADFI